MFRGFTGCVLLGGAIIAGAVLGSLEVMLLGAAAGAAIAATSCELGRQEEKLRRKQAAYPPYGY